MTPTDLGNAFSTMGFQPHDDLWFMDTCATSHMTNNAGTLLPIFNLSTHNRILAGNGNRIPITGHGHCSINTTNKPLCPP